MPVQKRNDVAGALDAPHHTRGRQQQQLKKPNLAEERQPRRTAAKAVSMI
jgi:hypothetical protein